MNIYVGNIPFNMTDDQLHDTFAAYGEVVSAHVIMDRETGRSRGFGFVEMSNGEQGQAAIQTLDGSDFGGRSLKVNEARPREPRAGGGGGGGGGRGGGGGPRRGGGGGGGRDRY